MPNLKILIPHTLSQTEALTRIQTFLPRLKSQHDDKINDFTETWSGNTCAFSFTASGFKVSGTLTVKESEVAIIGNIPLLAMAFKSKIEAIIRAQAEELLREK